MMIYACSLLGLVPGIALTKDCENIMFKNALISCANKEGLVEFVKPLAAGGMRIVSTGGTAKTLREAGVEVHSVSDQTGFPEVMDGRVKTLHPNIHMALLARDHKPEDLETLKQNGLQPFDLVVGNLYAFEDALTRNLDDRELTEFIDIGGPSFLRASAKSYERITVVCDPADYQWISEKKELTLQDRRYLAAKLYSHTSSYDAMISHQLNSDFQQEDIGFGGRRVSDLRYGENPHQKATWFRELGAEWGLHQAEILQGKALSYNNLLDLNAAAETLLSFGDRAACVSVKHLNPCGVAVADRIELAVKQSLSADPMSVFGGIIAINKSVNKASAEALVDLFLECIVATDFDSEALAVLQKKKNLRLLKWPQMMMGQPRRGVRSICGGFLVQSADQVKDWSDDWTVVGEAPDPAMKARIEFAWKVCAHLKSNAIAVTSGDHTTGLGMGQVNRVDAVAHALERSKKFHPEAKELILASDAFFPFPDSIEVAHQGGVKWIIQPGGSIKDDEVIAAAKRLGVNMVLTGQRHFQH